MSATMHETTLIRLVDAVAAAHPQQIEVIRAFQPLLLTRNRLLSEADSTANVAESLEPLAPHTLPVEADAAHEVLLRVLDAVGEGFPALWEGTARLREKLSPQLSARLCRVWLTGEAKVVRDLGDKIEITPELLTFVLGQTCRILKARAVARLPEAAEDITRRLCPYCGAAPELSLIHNCTEGATGARSLLCGQCGRAWRFKRTACPACGEDATETLQSLYVDGCPEERGVWCTHCNRYLLELDIRHRELTPEQSAVLALGLGHLDYLLQQEKKLPLAWSILESEHA